ncbi:MAG: hypothetical protein L6Q35_00485 [Phycisphaerales bacterium]|nr:hypothetical protein [Phycisphaerales bacterium]
MARTEIMVELVGGPLDGIKLPMSRRPPFLDLEPRWFSNEGRAELFMPPEGVPNPRIHRYDLDSLGKYRHAGCVSS